MRTALIQLAHRCRRLSLYLAAPALLLLNQGQARAVLIYNIYESAGDVVVMASGSLDLTGATKKVGFWSCQPGAIDSPPAILCAGPTTLSTPYQISGPGTFNQTVIRYPASSVSGIATMLYGFFHYLQFQLLTLQILQLSAVPHSIPQPSQALASPVTARSALGHSTAPVKPSK